MHLGLIVYAERRMNFEWTYAAVVCEGKIVDLGLSAEVIGLYRN